MEIGERIRTEREKLSISGRELAKRAQISPSFLSDIEKGRTKPSLDTLTALSKALGVSVPDLLEEVGTPKQRAIPVPNQILVPILHPSFLACAGDGHNLHGVTIEASEHIPIPEKDLGAAGEQPIFGVRVEGTSMEAADIKDGSVAIINPNQEIRYGDPCLVCFGIDEAAIKFVYPQPGGGLRIESADPSYKKHQFTKEEVEGGLVRVVGPVVATVWIGKPKRGI
jgi:transcriptional regulator with XRE-family HTH domain